MGNIAANTQVFEHSLRYWLIFHMLFIFKGVQEGYAVKLIG